MNDTVGIWAFYIAAGIAVFGALIHWIAPVLGPDFYAFLRAPAVVVQSARQHTWLAPVGALVIGMLMLVCALYALSGAGLIRPLPLLKTGILVTGVICLVRGLAVLPFLLLMPKTVTAFNIIASLIWFICGLGYVLGAWRHWQWLGVKS